MPNFRYEWMTEIFPDLIFWGAVAVILNELVFRTWKRYRRRKDG